MTNGRIVRLNIDKEAFKESATDTVLATPMAIALNFIMVHISLWLELSALSMTLFMTTVMFIFAVVRKYHMRVYFKRKFDK